MNDVDAQRGPSAKTRIKERALSQVREKGRDTHRERESSCAAPILLHAVTSFVPPSCAVGTETPLLAGELPKPLPQVFTEYVVVVPCFVVCVC